MMSRLMPRRGFTLVEVLVVTGIVCLLAAIIFPVMGRVRAAGRRTTCLSNLRQLGLALSQYAQDNSSFYPRIDFNRLSRSDPCAPWTDALFPYVKAEKVFECPSNPYGAYRTGCPANDKTDEAHPLTYSGSYSLNIDYGNYYKPPGDKTLTSYKPVALMSTRRYTRPSSTILLLDGDGTYVNPGFRPGDDGQEHPLTDPTDLSYYGVPDRHEGGNNVAFADGHVKWMSLNSLLKSSLWRINGRE